MVVARGLHSEAEGGLGAGLTVRVDIVLVADLRCGAPAAAS